MVPLGSRRADWLNFTDFVVQIVAVIAFTGAIVVGRGIALALRHTVGSILGPASIANTLSVVGLGSRVDGANLADKRVGKED